MREYREDLTNMMRYNANSVMDDIESEVKEILIDLESCDTDNDNNMKETIDRVKDSVQKLVNKLC